MKYIVNGREWEPTPDPDVDVTRLSDRLSVKSPDGTFSALAVRVGGATYASYRGRTYKIERASRRRAVSGHDSGGVSRAPMPGQIVEVSVEVGEKVEVGDRLMVLEAMKMQQSIFATVSGKVESLGASLGDQVTEGQVLAVVS